MFEINPLDFIPEELKLQARDALVDFVTEQAKKYLSDELSNKLKALRSDAAFNKQFEEGLQRAVHRFFAEYELQDEDLVVAIRADDGFFKNEQIQQALLAMIKKPGAYLAEENEQVLLSFESVLPQRKSRERVNRAVTYLLKCLAQELWYLPELQPIYSLQFQHMTAEATRQSVKLLQEQVRATEQMGIELRQGLAQLIDAMEKKLLAGPVLAALPTPRPKPYHNLPRPDYSCFVGREVELTWLRKHLHPNDRAWQIVINGIGGVGKSALALAIAHEYREKYEQLPPEERFDAIIWISAKEEVLTVQGREQASLPETVLHTLEDVYTAIAITLEREDITRALSDEQSAVVDKVLKEQRTLLVMDNLESVQDERIKPFLRNLPVPTKAIITSREWLDVADVWHLKGLSTVEADQLTCEEAAHRQVILDVTERQRIYDLTYGLPLPIKLAVARLSAGENWTAVDRWLGDATGELSEYCVAGQIELARQRDSNTWKLLLICSLFDRTAGASRDALGYIADLSIADRDSGLFQLLHLFLVNRTVTDRFWVLPIVQRFVSEQISKTGKSRTYLRKMLNWFVAYTEAKPYSRQKIHEWLDYIKVEYINILAVLRLGIDSGLTDEVLRLAMGTWDYPYITGSYREWDEIIQIARRNVTPKTSEWAKVNVEIERATLAGTQEKFQEVLDLLPVIEQSALERNDEIQLHAIWTSYSQALCSLGRLEEAEVIGQKALHHNPDNLFLKSTGAYGLSIIETERGNYAEAEKWLQIAEAAAEKVGAVRRMRSIHHQRGINLIRQGKYDEAESYIKAALEVDISLGELRYQAIECFYLAKVYAATNRLMKAQEFILRAKAISDQLQVPSEAKQIDEFLEQLDRQRTLE